MSNQRPHLVMFHHAGGNAASMSEFAKGFIDDFNVIQLEMPGRGRRRQESLLYHADQVIEDFASRIPTQGKIILLGHSLGAYIAYLMAAYCRVQSHQRQIILVAISNSPIHCRQRFSYLNSGETTHQQLLQFAKFADQLPDWLRQDPLLLQQFLQVLEADLNVANSINPAQSAPLDNIPLLVIYGTNDPLLPTPPLRWQECTRQAFHLIKLPGGHFILSQQGPQIQKIITDFIGKQSCIEE
ncbi:alpha/beta fold hydrolase [Xenorhabdus bovienii]|uniref:Alpha/beta fold hydrolase n=1 Tax=Xenorhabdus bovienii TaxID=40576 RepID=A0AAJ1MYG0_XENBV|nr:alpha/beta fold hydrolase [Xenorhabdus bovienii]MDE1477850.1 alpha/beta fold hydrolase [Xenorhabdus bovienii]MDE9510088.1 alpha/beta fold hydrolase [Xenorhabdus bovienii]MDE9521730.1 alpha/beta fold hydrolase [Xenorhabdus bovienii]